MSIPKKGSNGANTEPSESNYPENSVVPESAISDPRDQFVIASMNANLQGRISLTELARVANLSASHLSRLFKTQTGLSAGGYLRRLRMEKVRRLLATSFLSIKEVMAMVGYNNKGHFGRHFRRSFGLSPSEYRKRTPRARS
jgi:transcriptional regulator GlxA family with amidase domain